ncbi:hypothetical protein OAK38_00165 [Verrucomicrobia bacterium]|nr:hypothetical protein [Verrucomicrobiota bacterium]
MAFFFEVTAGFFAEFSFLAGAFLVFAEAFGLTSDAFEGAFFFDLRSVAGEAFFFATVAAGFFFVPAVLLAVTTVDFFAPVAFFVFDAGVARVLAGAFFAFVLEADTLAAVLLALVLGM